MSQTAEPSSTLVSLLKGIAAELISDSKPEVDLFGLRGPDRSLANDAAVVAPILSAEVSLLSSGRFRVEPVDNVYFSRRVMGSICYLGLIDTQTSTRRLFNVGGYRPGLSWNEELTGESLSRALHVQEDGERRREYWLSAKGDDEVFIMGVALRVSSYLRAASLTTAQRADLADHTSHTPLEGMNLERLAVACRIAGVTLSDVVRLAVD